MTEKRNLPLKLKQNIDQIIFDDVSKEHAYNS